LALALREDLSNGSAEDFFFVPLLIIPSTAIKGLYHAEQSSTTVNQQISAFIDAFVEKPLLTDFLESDLKSIFYNVKTVGAFEKGNTFGGSPNSGAKPKALAFQNCAWESVSAAANAFGVDRKLIRVKRDKGIMIDLTIEEFQNFTGIKVTNLAATNFRNQNPVLYRELLLLLFPTVAKKRASNGEP
jgi:hypothetical protein